MARERCTGECNSNRAQPTHRIANHRQPRPIRATQGTLNAAAFAARCDFALGVTARFAGTSLKIVARFKSCRPDYLSERSPLARTSKGFLIVGTKVTTRRTRSSSAARRANIRVDCRNLFRRFTIGRSNTVASRAAHLPVSCGCKLATFQGAGGVQRDLAPTTTTCARIHSVKTTHGAPRMDRGRGLYRPS